MSCDLHDGDLALYVEGELPGEHASRLEAHLRGCERCRELLDSLEESQRELKALAQVPLDETALAAWRARVLDAVRRDSGHTRPSRASLWAAAAVLAAVAVTALVLRRAEPVAPEPAGRSAEAAHRSLEPARVAPRVAEAAVAPARSTTRGPRPVSPGVESRGVPTAVALSPEEADQLARAVVAVSHIERLPEPAAEPAVEPDAQAEGGGADIVVLATSDPDVVIYWQMDSSGGG